MVYANYLNIFRTFLLLAMSAAILVIGILITVRKGKDRRILGIWLILEAVTAALSSKQFVFTGLNLPIKEISWIYRLSNIASAFIAILAVILLFLHAKINYRSKGLVAVIILGIGSYIIPSLVQALYIRTGIGEDAIMKVTILGRVISDIFLIACCVITLIAFIKGRYKDGYSTKIFVIPMLILIVYVIRFGVNSIVSGYASKTVLNQNGTGLLYILLDLLGLTVVLATGIIILAQKKRHKTTPQIVE